MRLEINKSYNLFTKRETITYKKVKVLSILSYDEALSVASSINQLAINEAVISEDTNTEEYLRKQLYYKLELLEGTKGYAIAWDDVIDFNRTTELDVDFVMSSIIKINSNASVSIDDVKKTLETAITSKFGSDVSMVNHISSSGSSDTTMSINEAQDKLADYENKLTEALNTFDKIISVLNKTDSLYIKLERLNVITNMEEIQTALANIEIKVDDIYQKV